MLLPGRPHRGFTLMETLVTLVVVAMVAGVLAEGLFQVRRLEQRLAGGSVQAQLHRLHAIWVGQALEGLQQGQRDGADRFVGHAREMTGLSTQLPTMVERGAQPFQLLLVYRDDVARMELRLVSHGLEQAGAESIGQRPSAVVLARWEGATGSFKYLDAQGQWHADWPAAEVPPTALPRAIGIDRGDAQGWLLVAAPLARGEPLARRVDAERMP